MQPTDFINAISRAAEDFLLNAQDTGGSWKDFLLPAGNSDIWVTGYAGYALAQSPGEEARRGARAAWRFLRQAAKSGGGWSYNAAVPGDADSTLWCLRLADALGEQDCDTTRAARAFLGQHLRNDGGLATYASSGPICGYIGLPPVIPFAGWTQSHVCVTAAGANVPSFGGQVTDYLFERRQHEGFWRSYWWFEDEYATSEAVDALAAHGAGASVMEAAEKWALERQEAVLEAGAFRIALWLRVLARSSSNAAAKAIQRGVAALAELQRPDGAWVPSARLRVPRPDVMEPGSSMNWRAWTGMPPGPTTVQSILQSTFTIYSLDHFSIFTTATALRALLHIEGRMHERPAECATLGDHHV